MAEKAKNVFADSRTQSSIIPAFWGLRNGVRIKVWSTANTLLFTLVTLLLTETLRLYSPQCAKNKKNLPVLKGLQHELININHWTGWRFCSEPSNATAGKFRKGAETSENERFGRTCKNGSWGSFCFQALAKLKAPIAISSSNTCPLRCPQVRPAALFTAIMCRDDQCKRALLVHDSCTPRPSDLPLKFP